MLGLKAPASGSELRARGYEAGARMGSGQFGYAVLVTKACPSGAPESRTYVAKLQKFRHLPSEDKERMQREVDAMRSLAEAGHPYLVRFRESFVEGDKLCIIMDYCDSGDLAVRIKRQREVGHGQQFPEAQVQRWLAQLIAGLDFLHAMHVLHRDIKPSSERLPPATLARRASEASAHLIPPRGVGARADLFLHRGSELKIGDLGLSKQILAGIAGAQKHTQCGSPVYLAPEVHMSQAYDGKVDIWAAGCTLYEVMMLRRAFTGDDMEEILAKVVYAVRAPRRRRRHREAAADPAAPPRHRHSNTARSLATGRPNWRSCCSRCSGCAPRSGRRRASSSRARTSRRRWRRSTRRPSRTWCAPRRRRRRRHGASSSPVASARDASRVSRARTT